MLVDEWITTSAVEVRRPELVWDEREVSRFSRSEKLRQTEFTLAAMRRSQKFVASPLVVETASGLGRDRQALDRCATFLFTPASTTWIDLTSSPPAGGIPGGRHGVLLVGDSDSIHVGQGMLVAHIRPGAARELTDWGGGGFVQVGFRYDTTNGKLGLGLFDHQTETYHRFGGNFDNLLSVLWSAIALINTPRLSEAIECDNRALNHARERARKPPILQYKTVNLVVDRGDLVPSAKKWKTGEMPLHHVRAFLRLSRGKVQLVRPHMRGNPRFGVVVHRYLAMRVEDEAGPWQGGPMPASRVIKELDDGINS